jgi:hypothetical protein
MKLFLLISLTVLTFAPVKKQAPLEKKYYFFCFSRSMNQTRVEGKQYALYTEFYEINTDPSNFRKLAHAWGEFVDNRCMNKAGCTSDLNYYEEEKMARKVYADMVAKYDKKDEFITSRIAFPYEEVLKDEPAPSTSANR